MLEQAHQRYLDDSIVALDLEIEAARGAGSAPTNLDAGYRLDVDGAGATYRLSLLYDTALPEGVPVRLEVAGRLWDAEVLQREGLSVLLMALRDDRGELPPATLPSALLHADPWYLTEALQTIVRDLLTSDRVTEPTDRLLGLLTGQGPGTLVAGIVEEETTGLNIEQTDALIRCLNNPIWFVWGPPGTGKTSTLGRVVAAAASSVSSLLVTAHSNVAVDAALLASVRAGALKRGRKVALGK